jgi:hypothetical protein
MTEMKLMKELREREKQDSAETEESLKKIDWMYKKLLDIDEVEVWN